MVMLAEVGATALTARSAWLEDIAKVKFSMTSIIDSITILMFRHSTSGPVGSKVISTIERAR
jgi:hypothetical protein